MRITWHRSDPTAFFVNSYIVELEHALIVVDTQFVLPEAANLVRKVQEIGKPLGGIFLTHPHPDHVNGTQLLLHEWPGTPVYATEATRAAIVELAGPKREQWKPILGDAYPDAVVEPTHIVGDGETVSIDGAAFKFYDVGALESINESIIEVPGEGVAFVGDLFYNNVHPWLIEGRARIWHDALEPLHARLSGFATLYVGHGEPAGPDAIMAQRDYMDLFFNLVRQVSIGGSRDSAIAEMTSRFPGWELEMLIPMNLDAVLTELA